MMGDPQLYLYPHEAFLNEVTIARAPRQKLIAKTVLADEGSNDGTGAPAVALSARGGHVLPALFYRCRNSATGNVYGRNRT
jgi:hypothetical protein